MATIGIVQHWLEPNYPKIEVSVLDEVSITAVYGRMDLDTLKEIENDIKADYEPSNDFSKWYTVCLQITDYVDDLYMGGYWEWDELWRKLVKDELQENSMRDYLVQFDIDREQVSWDGTVPF